MTRISIIASVLFTIAHGEPPLTRELTYSAVGKLETVRLYGNIKDYAYWFVDLMVGTPPQRASVIIDTGSTVCGFPCNVCKNCGTHIDLAFDISASSTASWSSCSADCPSNSCMDNHCSYSISYTEGSSISGYWFSDYVHLGDAIEGNLPVKSNLGCHVSETKLFYTQSANGILGMAPSRAGAFPTILSTLFSDERINKFLFSICLASNGGELVVGGHNPAFNSPGESLAWVPMRVESFYQLPLSKLRIGSSIIGTVFGRTIVDSGTTLAYFPPAVYKALVFQIEAAMQGVTKASARCWTVSDVSRFPIMTFEFDSVQVDWHPEAYMYAYSGSTMCYAFADSEQTETILGASWMVHKNVVFDLNHPPRLGISEADCPAYSDRPATGVAAATHADPVTTPQPVATTQTRASPATSATTLVTTVAHHAQAYVVPGGMPSLVITTAAPDTQRSITLWMWLLVLAIAASVIVFVRKRNRYIRLPEEASERVSVIELPPMPDVSVNDIESQQRALPILIQTTHNK